MSHPYFHAVSSARQFGGRPEDYQRIHDWFDESKKMIADVRHRALRHHTEGIFMCEAIFGTTIRLSTCKKCGEPESEHWLEGDENLHVFEPKLVPTRLVGEQHVREDMGFIPEVSAWLKGIKLEPWMMRSRRLSQELEREVVVEDASSIEADPMAAQRGGA
ncbi:MAG TPA: hypothetical protein VLA89_02885 [Gemmatimonadales bacterium]|nr:hypothetical protein [Gemmatimonadales bacterium]